MAKPAVFKLSAVDQAMMRIHMRFSLAFPCENSPSARAAVAARLKSSVRHAVAKMPMLAGTVSSVPSIPGRQKGQLEVRVTRDQLSAFQPVVNVLGESKFPRIYAELKAANMPPKWLNTEALTPLPDNPHIDGGGPAFAVQGSFIDGGFIVALYIHHSLADFQGMTNLLKTMSFPISSETPLPTTEELETAALRESTNRSCLMGAPATFPESTEPAASESAASEVVEEVEDNTCRILAFDLEKLASMKNEINKGATSQDSLSAFNTLAAILWKGITKARFPAGGEDVISGLAVPINIRGKLDPPLESDYYGNAAMPALTGLPVPALATAQDAGSIKATAEAIRQSIKGFSPEQVQGFLGFFNSVPDIRALSNSKMDLEGKNMVITSIEGIPTGVDSGLNLGLGAPEFGRMIARGHSPYFCVVMPRNKRAGVWEVHVELPRENMRSLLEDESTMQFVKYATEG